MEGEDELEGGEDAELRARGAGPEGDGTGRQALPQFWPGSG